MRLRSKTFLVVGLTFFGLLVALGVSAQVFVMGGFADLETRDTRLNVERVLNLIGDQLSQLSATGADWAFWDDTYRFVQDRNAAYIQGNLQPNTLTTLKIDFMVFIGRGDRRVFDLFVDPATQQAAPMPAALGAGLGKLSESLNPGFPSKGARGILMVDRQPVLVAVRPILKSDLSGPARGVLIVGRLLDAAAVERLASMTRLCLKVYPLAGTMSAEDFDAAKRLAATATPFVVKASGPDTVAGFALLKDIYGQQSLVVKASLARPIHRQGLAVLRYYIAFLLGTALAVMALVILFMDRAVLRPLNALAAAVGLASGRLDQPWIFARSDEIGVLGAAIDRFLAKIREQNQALGDANRHLEADIIQRRQAEADLARERDQLKAALAQVKTLSGLLPICASCKKIRNDKGYWEKIEVYIKDHSDADFSHGICPECARRLYGDLVEPQ